MNNSKKKLISMQVRKLFLEAQHTRSGNKKSMISLSPQPKKKEQSLPRRLRLDCTHRKGRRSHTQKLRPPLSLPAGLQIATSTSQRPHRPGAKMSPEAIPVETITRIFDLLDESDAKTPHDVEKHREMCRALMALRLTCKELEAITAI